jgi:hypothetical protein
LAVSKKLLAILVVLVAIIGGLSGLQVAKIRSPIVVTATMREPELYTTVTVTESLTQTSAKQHVIASCIGLNLGGGYTPGLASEPDFFHIGFTASQPGPGSLKIELTGLNRPITAEIIYEIDQPDKTYTSMEITIPAVSYGTTYSQLVPVPLSKGGIHVELILTPQNVAAGVGVNCLTLTWIPES